ncbi:hypothetical protein Vsou_24330 [Vulcanisaeta souniana JCM 11219]|uniref:Uncharacterized protein n=1 Tax=Vulcanisaeta souniana JCM 11219 TaxID=1293586 RepID=A0ABM8BR11_9CREN|nr:hypothetical protein Vsou_24330 [Vulcanisaeta souniana JCM 11219]
MKRWMNSSRTSGVPSHALIILCEGKHDYEFIKELISKINVKCDVKDQGPRDKDFIIGHVVDGKRLSYVPIIIEGGKDRLDGNVRLLISKLRSVHGSSTWVLILRDSDSNDADSAFDKLRRDIVSLINNPSKFLLYKPSMDCGQGIRVGSFVYYDCDLKYMDGVVHFRFIFVVPSLEVFLRNYEYVNDDSRLHYAIDKALSDPGIVMQ